MLYKPSPRCWTRKRRILFQSGVLIVSLALLGISSAQEIASQKIPYPSALNSSMISETDLSNLQSEGLVIGNGELNAIVYTSGNDIHLRISKNDSWDMRINTYSDPPMPTVNAAASSFTGTPGAPPSWNNYDYPTGLPCADVTLSGGTGQTSWETSTLNLENAVATVVSNNDVTTVRVLAQENVFYINSSRPISFTGINQVVKDSSGNSISSWVENLTSGSQNDYSYYAQAIPGDADVSGMTIYMVLGVRGRTQVIAVVTTRDSATPLIDAVALAQQALRDPNAISNHQSVWRSFWAKSGIEVDDPVLQRWWYHMLYYNRCFATAGANAVGLKAGFDALGGWHNSLKINYNTQETYFSGGPVNHTEFIEPLIDDLTRNLPRAEWFAATNFLGCSGAFFHSDSWPFEPNPADCTTPNKHQLAYIPWGYTWGMQGHLIFDLWDYYQYNPTKASLAKVYPVISQLGTFLCSVLELCPQSNGQWQIGPSFFPEVGSYGEYNTAYDIAYINCGLKDTLAAATLYGDTTLTNRCAADLANMPTYSTTTDPNQGNQTVIEGWLGSGLLTVDNHGSATQPVFPAGEITYFSSPDQVALFTRTIIHGETITSHQNSVIMMNISRARLSLSDAISNAKMCFSQYVPEQPNGLFYWQNGQGYYNSEEFGISRLVTEYLLQSVGRIIRLFPAWPSGTDAQFSNLGAIGGFEVSADQIGGVVENVSIKSTVGGSASILNPWGGAITVVEQKTGKQVYVALSNNIGTFDTSAGQTYLITPAASH
jgi:hypothetical protein